MNLHHVKHLVKKILRSIPPVSAIRKIIHSRSYLHLKLCLFRRARLLWWKDQPNLGDSLSPVVYNRMLSRKNICPDDPMRHPFYLLGIGSVIGIYPVDAAVWGSGILNQRKLNQMRTNAGRIHYKIYAVRGPLTAAALRSAGYDCPDVYGDPAVLMPLFYQPVSVKKQYPVSIIDHHTDQKHRNTDFHFIDVRTTDYTLFIDEICRSSLIVSSSLHGIILAEAYGVPAILLDSKAVRDQFFKFKDWYAATGRNEIKRIHTAEEAAAVTPMPLPDLTGMQNALITSFPYELFSPSSHMLRKRFANIFSDRK